MSARCCRAPARADLWLAISRSERNDLSGDVPDALFALLCDLDRFDLRNNDEVDGGTLAGHLARGLTNLKDQAKIDASNKRLQGMCVSCVEPSRHKSR